MARLKLSNVRSRDVWIFSAPLLVFGAIWLHHAVVNMAVIEVTPDWRKPGGFSRQMGFLARQGDVARSRASLLAAAEARLEDADALQIYIPENSWEELSADLPRSGWDWKDVMLDEGGAFPQARLRLRGDYGIHFFFEKKSLKIRPRKNELIRDRSELILSKKRLFQQHFLYALGNRLGLLCPTAMYTRVFRNHQYYGTNLNIEAIDEMFLRRRDRMPGNIYVGENVENTIHRDVPGKLLSNPYIWEKSARYNRHAAGDFRELADVLSLLELPDKVSRWRALHRRFDRDEVARFCAYTIVCCRAHMNEAHNLKFYVDPLSARMHPVVWDPLVFYGTGRDASRPGSPEAFTRIEKCDLFTVSNLFLHAFMEDPAFIGKVANCLVDVLEGRTIEKTLAETEVAYEKVGPFLAIDALDVDEGQPYTGLYYPEEIATLIRTNAVALRESLEDVGITWQGGESLDLSVRGFGGARFTGIALPTRGDTAVVVVRVSILGSESSVDWQLRRTTARHWKPSNPIHLNGGVLRESRQKLVPSPVSYRMSFLADGIPIAVSDPPEFEDLFGGNVGRNRLVEGDVGPSPIAHDSRLLPRPESTTRTLGTAGASVYLVEDLVVPRHQTLVIEAGTKIRLDPDVSIVCHGSVSVRGTKEQPVTIDSKGPGRPWGVFLVQGGPGVKVGIDHLEMRGGSEAIRDGVYYSGMLSLHYVDDAVIRDSIFEANRFGDDGLRAARCHVRLERCTFRNCNSDGVDFDLCRGEILDCVFVDNGNDALDFMSSQVLVRNCRFDRSGDKGVSCGEDSVVCIDGCDFTGNRIGMQAKDASFVYILGGEIRESLEYGIHAYAKNWRYADGGYVEVRGCSLDNRRDAHADARSRVWLVNSESRGSFNTWVSAWREDVSWDALALLRDFASVELDETFEDDFVSRSDGWTSDSPQVQFDKRGNVLHARSTEAGLSITRELQPVAGTTKNTIELLVGSNRQLELVLEFEGGYEHVESIRATGADRVRPHRFAHDRAILRVHLRSREPGCRVSIKKVRLWRR